jgi:hypothetical protein
MCVAADRRVSRIALALLLLAPGCADATMSSPSPTLPADAAPPVDAASTVDAGVDGAAPDAQTHAFAGINLPPTQGTSNAGAFMPGLYTWSYTNAQVAAANATFQSMRLPVNEASANDPASLARLKGFVDQFAGQHAIICMFGTTHSGTGTHGDGLPDGLQAMGDAWARVHAVFAGYPNVKYEIFNEPFGYPKSNPAHYVDDMNTIISIGGLPPSKCIVDGMGYADDIALVASGGWTGDLAYHFYPNWSSDHTQSAYSNLVQAKIGSLGRRTWITEFGADLTRSNTCYETFDDGTQPGSADINALRGLDDALRALRASGHGIKGAFVWHGWNNGDSYDFWNAASAQGACKVRLLQSHD